MVVRGCRSLFLQHGILQQVMIRHRIKRIAVGDTVVVYLAESTQVYDRDGGYLIGNYYALDIGKGVQK